MSKKASKIEAENVVSYYLALGNLKERFCVEKISFEDTPGAFYDAEWLHALFGTVRKGAPFAAKPSMMLIQFLSKIPNDAGKLLCLLDDFVYALSVEINFLNRCRDIQHQEISDKNAQLAEQAYQAVKEVRIGYLKKIYGDRYDDSQAERFSAELYKDCPPLHEAVRRRSAIGEFLQRRETPDLAQLRKIIELYS